MDDPIEITLQLPSASVKIEEGSIRKILEKYSGREFNEMTREEIKKEMLNYIADTIVIAWPKDR